ncbi:viperin family antiviral radical SAM protein [Marinomonas algicola]|uniref:viperin family antiviral radical SAM protein n=1 Tax=Marinomonas algicola TaxID=2773454 RepID=UPI00174EAE17|nr:viperin family antiviral radical SAM protein [Marinomonas algicola]
MKTSISNTVYSNSRVSSAQGLNTQTAKTDLVINFHMTESCNYRCSYCYATWDDLEAKNELHRLSGQVESLLQNLSDYFLQPNSLQAEMGYQNVRLNFAGGEPMLLGQRFLDAVKFANRLGFRTSLITNGHYLTHDILDELAPSLDVLGMSYDTADHAVAQGIGRVDRKQRWVSAEQLKQMCARYRSLNPTGVLKLNTVVNAVNCHDSLLDLMDEIKPNKWKLLRVLPVHEHQLTITQAEYQAYVQRHAALSSIIVEEDNDAMTHTYLMINPEGRFYQNSDAGCGYIVSDSILTAGVEKALSQVPFNISGFKQRYQLIPSVMV